GQADRVAHFRPVEDDRRDRTLVLHQDVGHGVPECNTRDRAERWWRWEELNLRHGAYETPALPLSYTAGSSVFGKSRTILPHASRARRQRSRFGLDTGDVCYNPGRANHSEELAHAVPDTLVACVCRTPSGHRRRRGRGRR